MTQELTSVFEPAKSNVEQHTLRNYNLIPTELKNSSIWLVAADENGNPGGKIPHVILNNGNLQRFTRKMGHDTLHYIVASTFAKEYGYDIGILLSPDLDYGVIDLDAKNIEDVDMFNTRMDNFKEVIAKFNSYSELSKSGKGYHIFVKTEDYTVSRNSTLHGIELYAHTHRFIVCTGNLVSYKDGDIVHDYLNPSAFNNEPIGYRDSEIEGLLKSIGIKSAVETIDLIEEVSLLTDDDVTNAILASHWAEKYIEVMMYTQSTKYETTIYDSASEACMFAICTLGRFTKSNEQVRRMFRQLPISLRDKYTKNDYHIDRCLSRIRTELDMTEVDAFIVTAASTYYSKHAEILENRMRAEEALLKTVADRCDDSVDTTGIEEEYESKMTEFSDIPKAHGLIGKIDDYIYARSPHKLRVASIGGALGIISGIVGSQYRFQGSSLNHFIVIIAGSTLGKESAAKGMNSISKALASIEGDGFFCFDKISSPQALRSVMTNSKFRSVVATFPEFSFLIDQIKDGKDSAMSGMYAELLDIFGKNSVDSEYGGAVMANVINNRGSMNAPAFSFVGDCTPNFYDGVTEQMCSSGFMSRLLLLHNDNPTKYPADKTAHLVKLDKDVLDELSYLVQQVKNKHASGTFINVTYKDAEVEAAAERLQSYLLIKYNKSKDEAHHQAYGRTWLKVMTIASLFAACNNLGNPTISMEDFQWAQALVMRDVFTTVQKLRDGEMGISESTCRLRCSSFIEKLVFKPLSRDSKAKNAEAILNLGIIPRNLLSGKLQGSSFQIGNMTSGKTLDVILDGMCKDGYISVVSDDQKAFLNAALGKNLRGVLYVLNHPSTYVKITELEMAHRNKTSPESVASAMNESNKKI